MSVPASSGTLKNLYQAHFDDDGELTAELLSYPASAVLPMRLVMARTLVLLANDPSTALDIA